MKIYPNRPPRLEHLNTSIQPFYFITFNTFQRQAMLARPEVHDAFLLFCTRAQERNVSVGRYVIMPDHIHLFVYLPPTGMILSAWIQSLRSILGKSLLGLGHQKPHWQEGFFDHLLRSSDSYSEKWEYIRMNPVRAELCSSPDEWPYQGEVSAVRF